MRGLKITLITIGALIVLFLVFAGFLPSLLSTKRGNAWLVEKVNGRLSGSVGIDSFRVSWFGKQSISGLAVRDSEGQKILSVDRFETNSSLFSFVGSRHLFGKTEIDKPYLYFVKNEKEDSNLEKALSSKRSKSKAKKTESKRPFHIPCFSDALTIHDGKFVFASPTVQPVVITDFELNYSTEQDIFHLKANTNQAGIKGEILASGNLTKKLHILAQINNFPVAVIDQLRDQSIFTTAIGETLNCTIETKGEDEGFGVVATLSSANLNGTIKGEVIDSKLVLVPNNDLIYTLTPSTFNQLLGGEQKKQWHLTQKVPVVISLLEGYLPLSPKLWDLEHCLLKTSITLDRAELIHHNLGPYTLSKLLTQFTINDGFNLKFAGDLLGKTQGHLNCEVSGDLSEKINYHVHSENFSFVLLDLVMDEAETLRGLLGDLITLDIEGAYESGASKTTVEMASPLILLDALIEGDSPQSLSFDLKGRRMLQDQWAKVLGPQLTFESNGKAGIWDKNFAITTLTGNIENETLDIEIKGKVGEKNTPFSCSQIQLSANGKLLKLPYQERFIDTELKKGEFAVTLDGKENLMKGTSKLQVAVHGEEGIIESKVSQIDFSIHDLMCAKSFDLKQARAEVDASLQHFPAMLITLLLPNDFDLSFITGPTLDAKVHAIYDPHNEDHLAIIDLVANSKGFKANLGLTVDGTLTVKQPGPASITINLTPDRYRELINWLSPGGTTDFSLSNEVKIEIALDEFKCPAKKPESLSALVCQTGIVGSISSTPMVFIKERETVAIRGLKALFRAENISESLSVDLSANVSGSASLPNEPSLIRLNGQLKNLWDHTGNIKPEALTILGEMSVEFLPIRQLLGVVPMMDQTRSIWRAILGDYVNAYVVGEVMGDHGPITVDLKASNFKAILPLQLTPNEILLRSMVEAEITLSDEVSEILLVDVNPLFITGARSEHPLKLYIHPEGFSFPINPFTFKGIRIDQAVLDIGKIQVRNGGEIQALMEFLKATDISDDKWMDAWFTPIFISLEEGTSHYKRFDILLANVVHIGLWGRIDLVKDKVKMTLGIAPSTLAQRFSVSGLSKKDMFQVKMRGKTSAVELDWSSAYTRIGIIVARLAGGHLAYLVGGVLESLITVFGDENTPPPTTDPFPWEINQTSANDMVPIESIPPKVPLHKRAFKGLVNFLLP